MHPIRFSLVSLLLLLSACASQEPLSVSDYSAELQAPIETEQLLLTSRSEFNQPELGTTLRYEDKNHPSDIIGVSVYPIDHFDWQNQSQVLSNHMTSLLFEIDDAVAAGDYLSREPEHRKTVSFAINDEIYQGEFSSLAIRISETQNYRSNIYLFIMEDKYLKIQTSFDLASTPDWNGDSIVKSLLPLISVPPESPYMRKRRDLYKEQMHIRLAEYLAKELNNE